MTLGEAQTTNNNMASGDCTGYSHQHSGNGVLSVVCIPSEIPLEKTSFLCESFQLEIGSRLGACVHSRSEGWDSICLAHLYAASVISLFICASCHVWMVLFAWCCPSPLSLRLFHLIFCIPAWSLKVDLVRTFHSGLRVLILLLLVHCLVVGLCIISYILQKETSHCWPSETLM